MAGCDQKEDVETIIKAFDFAVACENTVKDWNRCSAQTIANCFIKAGFITGPLPEPEPPRNVWENIQRVLETNMTFDEYALHDDDVETCEPLTDEAIIEAAIGQCDDGSADTDDPLEVDGDDTDSNPDISRKPQKDEIIWTSHNLDLLLKPKLMFYKRNYLKRQLRH